LQHRSRQLEKALQSGSADVDLARFLPPPDSRHRRAVLLELVKTAMGVLHRQKRGPKLEDFAHRYPELGKSDQLPTILIYEEYCIRMSVGDLPDLKDYRKRFPQQYEELQQRLRMQPPPPPGAARDTAQPQATAAASQTPPAAGPSPWSSPKPNEPLIFLGGQKFELLERIGQGQFGEVYRARAPGGVIVAVKRMYRTLDDESSQREIKAMETIRELNHPYLLQTHSYQAFEDRLLIVTELAEGSLLDRLKECQENGLAGIPIEELMPFFVEAAEALDYLHDNKLTHRDIKPANLLHLRGHAKVADFGIARNQTNELDQTTSIHGTPMYMPPEVRVGTISVHSDQYSFAMTWYEARTGNPVFPGDNVFEVHKQHMTVTPKLPGVGKAERRVLLKALAKKPDQRFASCTAFVQALKDALVQPATPARGVGRKIVLALLAVGLIAAALAWGYWKLF
jgi:hypothetical protein